MTYVNRTTLVVEDLGIFMFYFLWVGAFAILPLIEDVIAVLIL